MPKVDINYNAIRASEEVMGWVVKILQDELAMAFSCDGATVAAENVRVFAYERWPLDRTRWDIDISVTANDLPSRHNLEERLAPVAGLLDKYLGEQSGGLTYYLHAVLEAPSVTFDSTNRR